MPRKTPVQKQKIAKTFRTQEEALKFGRELRDKFREAGIRKRIDVVQDLSTGKWKVIEFTFGE